MDAQGDAGVGELVDAMWLAHAEIDRAARSEPLRGAVYRFAARLTEAARGGAA
ncbi:hypothetical protein ACWD26_16145 [Streptomyces sp. NPDC002787]